MQGEVGAAQRAASWQDATRLLPAGLFSPPPPPRPPPTHPPPRPPPHPPPHPTTHTRTHTLPSHTRRIRRAPWHTAPPPPPCCLPPLLHTHPPHPALLPAPASNMQRLGSHVCKYDASRVDATRGRLRGRRRAQGVCCVSARSEQAAASGLQRQAGAAAWPLQEARAAAEAAAEAAEAVRRTRELLAQTDDARQPRADAHRRHTAHPPLL